MKQYIVVELAADWPVEKSLSDASPVVEKFEKAIVEHVGKGYALHSFQVFQLMVKTHQMRETIVAIFQREMKTLPAGERGI